MKELKAVMVLKDVSQVELARELNISPKTLNRKINGRSDFTILEVFQISSFLGLTAQEVGECFFPEVA